MCITVWKTYSNKCYIIPGRYFGILKPFRNYIETTNTNDFTAYYSLDMPHALVFKARENYNIVNEDKDTILITSYDMNIEKFDSIFYIKGAKNINELRNNVSLIDLYIQEDYAMDKHGQKL